MEEERVKKVWGWRKVLGWRSLRVVFEDGFVFVFNW